MSRSRDVGGSRHYLQTLRTYRLDVAMAGEPVALVEVGFVVAAVELTEVQLPSINNAL